MAGINARDTVAVSCILGRSYSMTLEATLEAIGLDDVQFINPIEPTEGVVATALSADERAWAAQHAESWRQCSASGVPFLIFQDDTAFSSASNSMLHVTQVLATAVRRVSPSGDVIVHLGGIDSHEPAVAAAAGFTLMPARTASQASAYLLFPEAAAQLLAALPIDVPISAFLSKHVGQALSISPALAMAEAEYQAVAAAQRPLVQGS